MNGLVKRELSYSLLDKTWSINTNSSRPSQIRTVYWGAKKVPLPVYLNRINKGNSNYYITCSTYIRSDDTRPIILPLIGILTIRKGHIYPFAGKKSNFIDIIKTGRRRGAIVFVFTPDDIHWSTERITGFLFHPSTKQWRKCSFPFPDVVYNRIPTRASERPKKVQECMKRLQEVPNLTLFNPHFFNKQDLFQILEQSPTLKTYLPHTTSLRSLRDLRSMLTIHNQVYLKPTKGKAGLGIMKVSRSGNNWKLHTQRKQISPVLEFKSIQSLWSAMQKYTIKSPYIIQQGISLTEINGRPFDFRTLVQKDGQGTWQVSGLGLRVAGENRITTHVPQGGRIETLPRVLNRLFSKEKAALIEQRVKKLAVAIAKELENHYYPLGEMSMDIGLDKQENLWFFEANSKPMKFDEPDIRKRSLNNIIDYSLYVTETKQRGGRFVHAD